MRFIFLAFIVGVIYSSFSANAIPLPKTSITINSQDKCTLHIKVWLSPSCTHCAKYFLKDLTDITKLQGLCLDLHFLPHLYPLDMPVSVLIWSKGPEEAYKIAEFFYKNQDDWLSLSAARSNIDDPNRAKDLEGYLKEIESDKSKDLAKIRAYLEPGDPYLYVKICALRYFSVDHLEKYLPKNTFNTNSDMVEKNLGGALMSNLPSKDGKVLNFSPIFTSTTGELIPDGNNANGLFVTFDTAKKLLYDARRILEKSSPFTPEAPAGAAEKLLEKSGPFTPEAPKPTPSPPTPVKKTPKVPKKIVVKPEDNIQDADDDIERDDSEIQDADEDGETEEELPEDEDWEEENDSDDQLDEIIDEATS